MAGMKTGRLEPKLASRAPLLLGVVVAAYFVWIHRHVFAVGFMDEDFAWLYRLAREPLAGFLGPRPGVYYRPLSVNLPYLLFSGSPWLWRLLSFALVLGAAWFVHRLASRFVGREAAAPLAVAWLLSPANYFGLQYLNAFDYVLFPFLLFGFLHFTLAGRAWPALAFLLLGLGAKELGSLFFLFAWVHWLLHRRGLALPLAGTLATALFQAGKALAGQVSVTGGFTFVNGPGELLRNCGYLVQGLFWPLVNRSAEPWYPVASVVVLAALASLPLARRSLRRDSTRDLLFLATCFGLLAGALLLVLGIQYNRMGGIFWGLLLVLAAPFYALRLPPRFWHGAVFCLALAGRVGAEDSSFLARDRSALQREFLERASAHALRCAPGSTVVLEGLDALFGDSVTSEQVFWGLQMRREPIEYRILSTSTEGPAYHLHREFYVSPEEASAHPRIQFLPGAGGFTERLRNREGACVDWNS